jgi:TonB family protein
MTEAMGWIGYSVVVAALFGGAALALEQGLRQVGRPARGAWLVALAGSVLLPLAADLRPVPAAGAALALPVMSLPGLEVTGAAASGLDATSYLLLAWGVLSAVVLLLLVRAHLGLMRAARSWRELELEGGAIWVSARLGPAVVGVVRPRVVIPEWVLALPADSRSLLLLHEREHARAGDARLVAGAFLAAIAMPWNPLVWWQVARLRHAIELDCDARVLARGGPLRPYGALLLEVGRRRSEQPLLAAAFAERTSRLEQRIRALVAHTRARRPVRGALLALFGMALLGTAYCVRDPLAGNTARPADAVAERNAAAAPSFTAMTERPELLNPGDVQQALVAQYPPQLRAAGVGGRATVWAFIAEDGRVTKSQLGESSGHAALDETALNVLSVMRFKPARKEGAVAAVWIELPVVFRTNGEAGAGEPVIVPADSGARKVRQGAQASVPADVDTTTLPRRVSEVPSFTPMTVRPELRNAGEVQRGLVANYPPLLRDAGVGGMATVWFLIDETGAVRRTQLSRSSGRGELDEAALRVARTMRFTPAENRGTRVPVWVEIPIQFQAK